MNYCTAQNVFSLIPNLEQNAENTAVVNNAIDIASKSMDADLSAICTLSAIVPTPQIVTTACTFIAASFAIAASYSGGEESKETFLQNFYFDKGRKIVDSLQNGVLPIVKQSSDPDIGSTAKGLYCINITPANGG